MSVAVPLRLADVTARKSQPRGFIRVLRQHPQFFRKYRAGRSAAEISFPVQASGDPAPHSCEKPLSGLSICIDGNPRSASAKSKVPRLRRHLINIRKVRFLTVKLRTVAGFSRSSFLLYGIPREYKYEAFSCEHSSIAECVRSPAAASQPLLRPGTTSRNSIFPLRRSKCACHACCPLSPSLNRLGMLYLAAALYISHYTSFTDGSL